MNLPAATVLLVTWRGEKESGKVDEVIWPVRPPPGQATLAVLDGARLSKNQMQADSRAAWNFGVSYLDAWVRRANIVGADSGHFAPDPGCDGQRVWNGQSDDYEVETGFDSSYA